MSIFFGYNGGRFGFGGPTPGPRSEVVTGSRRTIRTCLPPLTAERPHRDGSTGTKWWSNGESNSGRRSCKDQLQPAACPEMVPSARFELASCVLQTRAITRFANWAKLVRTSVIETDSPEWHSGARPSGYVRNDAWWVTLESNQAGTKAQALQARSVPRLGVTQIGCGSATRTRVSWL